ncbi:aspartic proteinase PCS1-like [Canna indica]|uniref:Aspartic proteinase PCS1-like n=1 Tax=Canna indica TaxID=4628 RepID=A0AAQ3KFT8_9LILI|nr:aspartic proteinase PCS1-like [Canna indica]
MVTDKGAPPNEPTAVVLAAAAEIECHLVHAMMEEWAGVLCSLAAKERDTCMEPLLEAKAPPTVIFFARASAPSRKACRRTSPWCSTLAASSPGSSATPPLSHAPLRLAATVAAIDLPMPPMYAWFGLLLQRRRRRRRWAARHEQGIPLLRDPKRHSPLLLLHPRPPHVGGVVLLLGDAQPPFPLLLNYTPLIEISLPLPYFDRVAYSVQLKGIRVAGTLLPIPKSVLVPDHTGAGHTMVDSGSQFTFLLGPAYNALKAEFSRQTKGALVPLGEPDFVFEGAFDLCYWVPTERSAPPPGLPAVVLLLRGGAEVAGERLLYRAPGEAWG